MFDLTSPENHFILPKFELKEAESLKHELHSKKIGGHILISSSGTTGGKWKGYLISKHAMFTNAAAVNERLKLSASEDIWGATLPEYHIGGLSIFFRASLLGHTPVNLRPWAPQDLVREIENNKVTAISLVPTQVYDLVRLNIRSPKQLKVALVGGDFLSQELGLLFCELGWPLIRTFGMTEVSSQLCTGTNAAGEFEPLSIHQIMTNQNDDILVRSQSSFSYLVTRDEGWKIQPVSDFTDEDGFLKLPDKGRIHNGKLQVLGRSDGLIKVSGHLLNLGELKETLDKFMLRQNIWGHMELTSESSERSGQELVLNCDSEITQSQIDAFTDSLLPIRISRIAKYTILPRTPLGKFIKQT